MHIPVRDCLHYAGESLHLEQSYQLLNLPERHDHLLHMGEVRFGGEGKLQSGIFVITGKVTGDYTLSCVRCLAHINVPFTCAIEERFSLQSTAVDRDDEEEEEIHEVHGHMLDLQPYIEESILISVPYAPRCQSEEKCRSRLPDEGHAWRVIRHQDADKDTQDPRLADLARFFDDTER